MTDAPMLFHSVYFSLVDNSPAGRQRFIAACRECLAGHAGEVFFAVGPLADDISWPISDQNFDIALHIVFANKAAHDVYQDSPLHTRFLEEQSPHCTAIRVFDAYAAS